MGAYDSDPRVERVSETEYRIPESDRNCHWTARQENWAWNTYDQHGTPSRIVCGFGTADGAIKAIIGDPR